MSIGFDQASAIAFHRPAASGVGSSPFAKPSIITSFETGEEIFSPGQKVTACYTVQHGAVRIHKLLSDGRRQIISFHFAGEVFGLEAGPTRRFFAEAVAATAVKAIPTPAKGSHCQEITDLALASMSRAQEHIAVIGRQNAIERMAGFLVDIAERQGNLNQLDLPMPRLDIADYLGLTIETVSRVFAKLRSSGLIRLRSIRSVELRDIEELRLLCC